MFVHPFERCYHKAMPRGHAPRSRHLGQETQSGMQQQQQQQQEQQEQQEQQHHHTQREPQPAYEPEWAQYEQPSELTRAVCAWLMATAPNTPKTADEKLAVGEDRLKRLCLTLANAGLSCGIDATEKHIDSYCSWVQSTYFDGITTEEHGADARLRARRNNRMVESLVTLQDFAGVAAKFNPSSPGEDIEEEDCNDYEVIDLREVSEYAEAQEKNSDDDDWSEGQRDKYEMIGEDEFDEGSIDRVLEQMDVELNEIENQLDDHERDRDDAKCASDTENVEHPGSNPNVPPLLEQLLTLQHARRQVEEQQQQDQRHRHHHHQQQQRRWRQQQRQTLQWRQQERRLQEQHASRTLHDLGFYHRPVFVSPMQHGYAPGFGHRPVCHSHSDYSGSVYPASSLRESMLVY